MIVMTSTSVLFGLFGSGELQVTTLGRLGTVLSKRNEKSKKGLLIDERLSIIRLKFIEYGKSSIN